MYTDEDLNLAVEQGIFSQDAVIEFRDSMASHNHSPAVDEENIRLVASFNDIFVVIACCLLLFSSLFVLKPINETLGYVSFIAISWGLAEFFVLRKRMALPAIVLMIAFVGGVFALLMPQSIQLESFKLVFASGFAAIAAYAHWRRFHVPITVATGTFAALALTVSSLIYIFPLLKHILFILIFMSGVITFAFAMYWDSSDTSRTTSKSDVAFWLHLISAPLIIHPVFSMLDVLGGNESVLSMSLVVVLYLLMTIASLIIDRRAFMVSSLIYVVYALSTIFNSFGSVGYGFALTGVIMGSALLLLSAFWHSVRRSITQKLPQSIRAYVPEAS
ncbi:hypothetical protein J3L16_11930 [Alteromonas sp. 5E99-2]|uniref:hypothetical protein n=1 Tax=Alteromonas sp. 5E99-2 TaxID=2817683 RepID=UPI001A9932FD|nr:hypothetical protein [Alteromonas sp. 5E99-2]MBO1256392.1 hypothetical protein [Alteromonas sp. 5E99-2]